jgi:hypothetical protein
VLLELPTRRLERTPASTSRHSAAVLSYASSDTEERYGMTGLESEQNLALVVALGQLPSGMHLVVRDMSGREWCIKPGRQMSVVELREAA